MTVTVTAACAERLIWEKLPPRRWIPQDEIRDLMRNELGLANQSDAVVDQATDRLVQLKYVAVKMTPGERRPARAEVRTSSCGIELDPPPSPPKYHYWRNKIEDIPLEFEVQRANEEAARLAREAKAAKLAGLEAQLRELGVHTNANMED
jgi:hypothetical protein